MKIISGILLVLSLVTFIWSNSRTYFVDGEIVTLKKRSNIINVTVQLTVGQRYYKERFNIQNCDLGRDDKWIRLKVVLIPFFDKKDPNKNLVVYSWKGKVIKRVRVHNRMFVKMYRCSEPFRYNHWSN